MKFSPMYYLLERASTNICLQVYMNIMVTPQGIFPQQYGDSKRCVYVYYYFDYGIV